MSKHYFTEEAIAKSFKHLVEEHSLSKISVKNIIEKSGVSRNTFYYHFKDKYELMTWLFQNDMRKNVEYFSDPLKLKDNFVGMCRCMYKDKKFYQECFKYEGQNSLYEFLYEFYYQSWECYLENKYFEENVKFTAKELHIMTNMLARALMGILKEWISNEMTEECMEYFVQMLEALQPEIYISQKKSVQNEEKYWRRRIS